MEMLSKMGGDELNSWLLENGLPQEVLQSFKDNEMDGESLAALIATKPGPDSLKDLVQKVGLRMKLYKAIKALYDEEAVFKQSDESLPCSSPAASTCSVTSDKGSGSSSVAITPKRKPLPVPFPIPDFRIGTETNLANKILTDSDRKYMVQILATMLMTYVQRPSIQDCQAVSTALHSKFKFLGNTVNSWKWFIYNRTQNVNRPEGSSSSTPKRKKIKIASTAKHSYPEIPVSADDEESNQRNLSKLKEESAKVKPSHEIVKTLLIRTYPVRRASIMDSSTVTGIIMETPMLKKCAYMTLEFGLVMQRPNIREEFDDELYIWSKAVINYCKTTQKKCTAIQILINNLDTDPDPDDSFFMAAIRCLALLLIPTKTKQPDGDIPYVMKFIPDGTPPLEAPDSGNNQPHIVAIERDEYYQFMIATEQTLMLDCTELATALFLLLASHYVFNLSYHSKADDFFTFIQENIVKIPTDKELKKRPVGLTHMNGISSMYHSIKENIE